MLQELAGFNEESWASHLRGLVQFAARATSGALGNEPTSEKSLRLIRKIESFADSDILRVLQPVDSLPEPKQSEYKPQCTAGCHYCCYQWVRCSVPEAILVFRSLEASRSESEMITLKESVRAYSARLRQEVGVAPQIPCPLLTDGLCSVYESRPLICRGTMSLDVKKCEAGLADPENVRIPYVTPTMYIAGTLKQGIGQGLAEAKLSSYEVVLGYALQILFDDPRATDKFWAGEDSFAAAKAPASPAV